MDIERGSISEEDIAQSNRIIEADDLGDSVSYGEALREYRVLLEKNSELKPRLKQLLTKSEFDTKIKLTYSCLQLQERSDYSLC